MYSTFDERFMRRALALARRGGRRVSPNPQVGCVLVRGGLVVGEGWHAEFGGPHAEPRALARAGRRARGAAAYVNLEPCCHDRKKTPPCVDALIRAGVRRVVAGMADPNPAVSGRGLRKLRAAKIRTDVGLLEAECRALNRPFIVRMTRRRPYVILKAAASLDGRIETAGGESKWITSPQARRLARRMRAEVDAVLVGIGTVLADDPRLTARGPWRKYAPGTAGEVVHLARGLGPDPMRIVLDPRLRVPRRAHVLDGSAPTLIVTRRRDYAPLRAIPARAAAVLTMPGTSSDPDRIDLVQLLARLHEWGVGSILVEGGSAVHTSFLEAGLVDEIRLFLAPKLLGGARARGFFEGGGIRKLRDAVQIADMSVRRVGPDLLVTGRMN